MKQNQIIREHLLLLHRGRENYVCSQTIGPNNTWLGTSQQSKLSLQGNMAGAGKKQKL